MNNPAPSKVPVELLHFLDANGIRATKFHRLDGGANNQSFRVRTDEKTFFAKVYFRHENDPRDRLSSEFTFLQYAWGKGIRNVPEPLAMDDDCGIGLYGFLEGNPMNRVDIDEDTIKRAGAFIRSLNVDRPFPEKSGMTKASEACFSNAEHIACVQKRVDRLTLIDNGTPHLNSARELVRQTIVPLWERIRQSIPQTTSRLEANERCISPSDFGFHNAIRSGDGMIQFFDFEYAGWDDPAKMVCDFFSQPKVLVDERFLALFLSELGAIESESLRDRVDRLFPLFRLKWLCIMFNEFLPMDGQRRSFSLNGDALADAQTRQLLKIQSFLKIWFNS